MFYNLGSEFRLHLTLLHVIDGNEKMIDDKLTNIHTYREINSIDQKFGNQFNIN